MYLPFDYAFSKMHQISHNNEYSFDAVLRTNEKREVIETGLISSYKKHNHRRKRIELRQRSKIIKSKIKIKTKK